MRAAELRGADGALLGDERLVVGLRVRGLPLFHVFSLGLR